MNRVTWMTFLLCLLIGPVVYAQQPLKPYENWPDIDPEWNKLTNHIMWCYNSLRDREFVARGDLSSFDLQPTLVCPFRDYLQIAKKIDDLAPDFIDLSLAGSDGHFSDYFTSTSEEGRCPTNFPYWTPESLHSAAFGRAHWSTNTALMAWIAVTNRAFVAEVTAAIHKLQWTLGYSDKGMTNRAGWRREGTIESSDSIGVAAAQLEDEYIDSFTERESVPLYSLYAENCWISEDEHGWVVSSLEVGQGELFLLDDDTLDLNAYTAEYGVYIARPTVLAFMSRDIICSDYLPTDINTRQRMFFCQDLGQYVDNQALVTSVNPFWEGAGNVFPLEYAQLDTAWHEDLLASYSEDADAAWLLKWGFELDNPPLPNAPPAETLDTDRDDLVEIPPLAGLPGSDTGTFIVTHEDANPVLYLPLSEPLPWESAIPVHDYLTQRQDGLLPYHYMAATYDMMSRGDGLTYTNIYSGSHSVVFSRHTHIEEIGEATIGGRLVQQVLVVRPRGQVVVFEFPWEGTKFSDLGYPTGVNKNRGYVLDRGWAPWGFYFLKFPSGIVHDLRFCNGAFESVEVVKENHYKYEDYTIYGHPGGWCSGPEAATNGRYRVSIEWQKGMPVSLCYYSSLSNELCETVEVQYDGNRAVRLLKSDASANARIVGDGVVSYGNGDFRFSRQQVGAWESGARVTVSLSLGAGVEPCWTDERQYDAHDRLTSHVLSSGQLSPVTTEYVYPSATDTRAPVTGRLVRNLPVERSVTGSYGTTCDKYEFTPDEGWLSCRKRVLDGGYAEERYEYYPRPTDPFFLFFPADSSASTKSVTKLLGGESHGKTLFNDRNYDYYNQYVVTCIDPATQMLDGVPTSNVYTSYVHWSCAFPTTVFTPRNSYEFPSRTHEYGYSLPPYDGSPTQLSAAVAIDFGARTNTYTINFRGAVLYSKTQAREGAILEETFTDVDGRGRPMRRRYMDGTEVSFQEYCLHGPRKIINRDKSVTTLEYDAFGRVKKRVDGETEIIYTFSYDPMGHVIYQTRKADGNTLESRATYGIDGALLYSKDEQGHEITVTGERVNGLHVVTRSETGRGDVVETYWADGMLKAVDGPGAAERFHRLRGVTDNKLWVKEINPDNPDEWARKWYAFSGLPERTVRSGGAGSSYFSYDATLSLSSVKDGDGVVQRVSYDWQHGYQPSLSGVSRTGGEELDLAADPFCAKREYAYTPAGLTTRLLSYPEAGDATPFEEASAHVSADGRAGTFSVQGKAGGFSYDMPPSTGSYTLTIARTDGGIETHVYRKFLLRESVVCTAMSPSKVTRTYSYDGFRRLTAVTTDERGFKETVTIKRDAQGFVDRLNSSSRGVTTFTRNASDQVTQMSGPAGTSFFDWLENGAVGSIQNNDGPLFSRVLDSLGRDRLVTRQKGGITSTLDFSYGDDGGFDQKARDGSTTLFFSARRADGRPYVLKLPGEVTVSHEYDSVGLLKSRTWVDPSNTCETVSESFAWHRDGRLSRHAQPGGPQLSNHVFRAGGRVQSEKTFFDSPDGSHGATVRSCDELGRTSGATTLFDGFEGMPMQVGAEYDGFGHLATLSGDGFYATFSCAAGGLVTNTFITVGGNELLKRAVTWSASAGKPARVDYTLEGQFLRRWQYAFANGRVSSCDRAGGDGYRTSYTYDAAGQLTVAASCATNGTALQGLSFAYGYATSGDTTHFGRQANQNMANCTNDLHKLRLLMPYLPMIGRVSATGAVVDVSFGGSTNSATVVGNMYYSPLGIPQLMFPPYYVTSGTAVATAKLPGGVSETATVSVSLPSYFEYPTYNARGMILSDSRRRYVWDAAGRLTSVTNTGVSPAVAVKFEYYPDGRRARKTVLQRTNGAWAVSHALQYAWQGWKLAAECERDGANNITAVRHFVWGPDIHGQRTATLESAAEGIGGLLLVREWKPVRGVRVYLPVADGLGSVCALVDASDSSLAAEYDYDPYGAPVAGRGPAMDACPFRHRTRYYDPEIWLYYYGYRYYDPSVTKWISKDPLGEAGGWNLTAFCGNDPVNRYDSLGLDYVTTDGNDVYWVIESDGLIYNKDDRHVHIGADADGVVSFTPVFGCGSASLKVLKKYASRFWDRPAGSWEGSVMWTADISGESESSQNYWIKDYLQHHVRDYDYVTICEYRGPFNSKTTRRLDQVQTGLDVVGMTPGYGIIADAPNTVLYGLRGKWVDFGFGLAACLPVAGQYAAATKLTGKAADYADDTYDLYKATLGKLDDLDFATGRNKAIFYSGPGNRAKALEFARRTGRTPIDFTQGGRYLESLNLYDYLPSELADDIWAQASRRFAGGASGQINLFVRGADPKRVYKMAEEPILTESVDVYRWIMRGY